MSYLANAQYKTQNNNVYIENKQPKQDLTYLNFKSNYLFIA